MSTTASITSSVLLNWVLFETSKANDKNFEKFLNRLAGPEGEKIRGTTIKLGPDIITSYSKEVVSGILDMFEALDVKIIWKRYFIYCQKCNVEIPLGVVTQDIRCDGCGTRLSEIGVLRMGRGEIVYEPRR